MSAPRVRVLDARTAELIAAGEVIERPASVVKELVENALDAGAARVAIDLADGGRRSISVSDDGCGMTPEELGLAVRRHATSKIRGIDDLSRLDTLGFRGEALPSIGAVARLELLTRPGDETSGFKLVVEGGEVRSQGEAACACGTTAVVASLFFNTPARRKQLDGAGVELARVADVVYAAALGRPDVKFRLTADGRELLATPGRGGLEDLVALMFGPGTARELLPVERTWAPGGEHKEIRVKGVVGTPSAARGSRSCQFFYVNGRPVKCDAIRGPLEDAHRTLLPLHRFPFAVLFLELAPEELDVNVHPGKMEVRFVDEAVVRDAVRSSVGEALRGARLIPTAPDGWSALSVASQGPGLREPDPVWEQVGIADDAPGGGPGGAPGDAGPVISSLRPLGQVRGLFIVAEGPDGAYFIDQHAAHERVYYEKLSRAQPASPHGSQELLVPFLVDLTPAEHSYWEANAGLWRELGFEWEAFGARSLLVRAVPAAVAGGAGAELVRDLLDRLRRERDVSGRERAAAALAACKAAVKARERLSTEEMQQLLSELAATDTPYTCPHGRPTIVRLEYERLLRMFRRA